MSAETAAVLRDAKALIDTPEKWARGRFSRDGGFCALGAVRVSRCKVPALTGERARAADALKRVLPRRGRTFDWTVWEFNDDPATTHADVMALFDRAIAAEEPVQ